MVQMCHKEASLSTSREFGQYDSLQSAEKYLPAEILSSLQLAQVQLPLMQRQVVRQLLQQLQGQLLGQLPLCPWGWSHHCWQVPLHLPLLSAHHRHVRAKARQHAGLKSWAVDLCLSCNSCCSIQRLANLSVSSSVLTLIGCSPANDHVRLAMPDGARTVIAAQCSGIVTVYKSMLTCCFHFLSFDDCVHGP